MEEAIFWIRIHDLPLMARNEHVGQCVGEALSRLIEVDVDVGEVEWGEFMRVRVAIYITKPLIQRKKFNIDLPKPFWLHNTYERLLNLCFCYGLLGQRQKDCKLWPSMKESFTEVGLPYGNWLKVGLPGGASSTAPRSRSPLHCFCKLMHTKEETTCLATTEVHDST